MTESSKAQISIILGTAVLVLVAVAFNFGKLTSKQYYINYGAEQHWQGKIECGRVGEEIFCAKTGDKQ